MNILKSIPLIALALFAVVSVLPLLPLLLVFRGAEILTAGIGAAITKLALFVCDIGEEAEMKARELLGL